MSITIANTAKGKMKGISLKAYTVFKGIPYAKPPVGDLRWKAPQEVDAWDNIYLADTFPRASMQEVGPRDSFYDKEFYSNPEFVYEPSEDSLYLNIWTPAKSSEENLPVAIWIHGGAFMGGYGSELEFDGEAYCKRGVILVTINYRLNIFGFMAHPWLSAENNQGISGNYGILDQIAAINWVYNNITAFGGDPSNITIFGQSAGAMSVQTLVSSDLTENMISKAIMQSGGGYDSGLNRDDMTLKHAEKIGQEITDMAGIKSIEEFRAMSAKEVLTVFNKAMPIILQKEKSFFMVPVIDGHVLKEGYNLLIDQKKVKNIPYMLGSTKDDILVDPEDVKAGVPSKLQSGCIAWSKILDDPEIKPAYVYEFRRDLPGDEAGAFHSAELWYMFGTMNRCWRQWEEHDYKLSDLMLDYWSNFMRNGNPNRDRIEDWRPCTKKDTFVKVLG
ncbi:carboxylesterase/lipase family protein [Bacillus sp. USDA818B3_A]|uniref:carboxylesterase/lipase family protein n=1 Tax=Bacillus sp. USDA818B3_A TaxID=2698834 RepID=UPI00136D5F00|nr:carboxylesterase family protein [Bacillus sp. USDA818B3_A]